MCLRYILIVDDGPINRKVVKALFESLGVLVDFADGGPGCSASG
ncbi:MAG: hypothetical protein M2R45_00786 [Verrucomicrobia subdivision 3 bacterium]|nr:hypothetical protein [Limisphaerales bacterium]MCS1413109.1 hypothetical protein [Limisphaerales bacterium]